MVLSFFLVSVRFPIEHLKNNKTCQTKKKEIESREAPLLSLKKTYKIVTETIWRVCYDLYKHFW